MDFHWELSVLSRAIAYKNLTGAASNIGLSQPQLSRIVSKLEQELSVVLLDRTSRRKSGWTPAAYRLAETYSKANRSLESEILRVVGESHPTELRVGTLEGLIDLSTRFVDYMFRESGILQIELDVHDLNALEEQFFEGTLDLIFVSREPGRKKFKNSRTLGYQSLEAQSNGSTTVLSSFEFQTRPGAGKKKSDSRLLVSNSLLVRRHWVDRYGGRAIFPSKVHSKADPSTRPPPGTSPVYLVGGDLLPASLWGKISEFDEIDPTPA